MGNTMAYIIYLIAAIIFCVGGAYLSHLVLGLIPFFRAKELSETDKNVLKKYGICHKTTEEGVKGIQKDGKIKGSKGMKAYSTQLRSAAYVFASAYMADGEAFNENTKYQYSIYVKNLSDEQIEKMRIRTYDKAVASMGGFDIIKQNEVTYIDMGRKKLTHWQKTLYFLKSLKTIRIDKCMVAVLTSGIIGFSISGVVVLKALEVITLLAKTVISYFS